MSRILQLTAITALALLVSNSSFADDEEPVFSGPQIGEKMSTFAMKGAIGEQAGKDIDLLKLADGKPTVIIFVHKRTRPAFGLTNAVMKMVVSRNRDKDKPVVTGGVCFLTNDATDTATWMKRIPHYFPKGASYGISNDGLEGPGAYGLNRNVTLTVLIAQDDKVTANFALVQPSIQSDGPKIFKAVVDCLGGGDVPKIAQFLTAGRRSNTPDRPGMKKGDDPDLVPLLRQLIQKTSSPEEVEKAAKAIEKHLTNNKLGQRHIHRVTNTIINAGKLENYGNEHAQKYLKKWSKEFPKTTAEKDEPKTTKPSTR
jgi:hypothetical protein